MTRTTLDIDPTVLQGLQERARLEGRSMGKVASELLAMNFASARNDSDAAEFKWSSEPMGAKVDLDDKAAVAAVLGEDSRR